MACKMSIAVQTCFLLPFLLTQEKKHGTEQLIEWNGHNFHPQNTSQTSAKI